MKFCYCLYGIKLIYDFLIIFSCSSTKECTPFKLQYKTQSTVDATDVNIHSRIGRWLTGAKDVRVHQKNGQRAKNC